jgi:hypothetical protein
MELIPTLSKAKLPKGYSYPVGAEALSAALRGVPQYPDISILFSWRDTYWASKYQTKLKAAGRIDLIALHFNSASPWQAAGWSICVHAVPLEHAQKAREMVARVALPALRAVLASSADHCHVHWKASYDLANGSISVDG